MPLSLLSILKVFVPIYIGESLILKARQESALSCYDYKFNFLGKIFGV